MERPSLKALADAVLVHMPERHVTSVRVAGRDLYFDPSWNEQGNKNLRGVVLAPPAALTRSYLLQRGRAPKDRPHWGVAYKFDIQEELRTGDIVYCDVSVSEPQFAVPGLGDGGVYRAGVEQVVAIVRDGEIIPYGSYVLLEPVWPDDVEEVEVLGKKRHLRVSKSGLTLGGEDIPPLPWQGRVRHVGAPLRGQRQQVQVGDRVVLDKRMCGNGGVDGYDGLPLRTKIDGTTYYCIRQDFIEAVFVAPVPGHNFDTEIIHGVFHELGEPLDIPAVFEAFTTDKPLLIGGVDVVALVRSRGGITKNPAVAEATPDSDVIEIEFGGKKLSASKADVLKRAPNKTIEMTPDTYGDGV